jgi:hypothetical protein
VVCDPPPYQSRNPRASRAHGPSRDEEPRLRDARYLRRTAGAALCGAFSIALAAGCATVLGINEPIPPSIAPDGASNDSSGMDAGIAPPASDAAADIYVSDSGLSADGYPGPALDAADASADLDALGSPDGAGLADAPGPVDESGMVGDTGDTDAPIAPADSSPESASVDGSSDGSDGARPPTGISLGPPVATPATPVGNPSPSDATYDDICPRGQAVVGYVGFMHSNNVHVCGFQVICGQLNLSGNGPWRVSVSGGASFPLRGCNAPPNGSSWQRMCPTDQVVVSFATNNGANLDGLAFSCAALVVSPGGASITVGSSTALPWVGSTGTTGSAACAPGSIVVENHIRAGARTTALGLGCSKVSLTY